MDVIFPLVVCCAILFLFVILREVHCWFWKINKIVELLEVMERKLSDIRGKVDAINRQGADL